MEKNQPKNEGKHVDLLPRQCLIIRILQRILLGVNKEFFPLRSPRAPLEFPPKKKAGKAQWRRLLLICVPAPLSHSNTHGHRARRLWDLHREAQGADFASEEFGNSSREFWGLRGVGRKGRGREGMCPEGQTAPARIQERGYPSLHPP